MGKLFNVALLGATGAVGKELISILEERQFPIEELRLLASPRSAGVQIPFRGENLTVSAVSESSFDGCQFVFMSAGAGRAKEWAPVAQAKGAIVIDNSSAFRSDPEVPLVVPEINSHALCGESTIVSVPNCSAILLLMAVAPLRTLGTIKRIIVSTYQSASGAGAAAMDELRTQTELVLQGGQAVPSVFPHPIAFNLFSHNTSIDESGYNDEERKVISESRKILEMPELCMNVTCIRVPVMRAHSESVTIEFESQAPSLESVRNTLEAFPGVSVVDDRDSNTFPMPLSASGQDDVLVGRIREDLSNPNAICLFLSGDQLRKGAALNAVQIAEALITKASSQA